MAVLWNNRHSDLAKSMLQTLTSIENDLVQVVVEEFLDDPGIVIPLINENQRYNEMYNCAFSPKKKEFARLLMEAGTNPKNVLGRLIEDRLRSPGFFLLGKNRQVDPVNILEEWMNEWQSEKIYQNLECSDVRNKISKI